MVTARREILTKLQTQVGEEGERGREGTVVIKHTLLIGTQVRAKQDSSENNSVTVLVFKCMLIWSLAH